MADTTSKGFPYPEGPDAVDVAGDIQLLAEAVDDMPGVQSYTGTEIGNLTAGEKWAGRIVWNSTTSKLQVSNGSTFSDVDSTVALSSATPAALGAAAAGSGTAASKDDHVHAMPGASDVGAIANSLVQAKGSLIAASAASTPANLNVGANDTLLVAASGETTGLKWASLNASQIPTLEATKVPTLVQNAQTDSYTLVLGDAGKLIEMGKATAQTLTVPPNSSVAFPTGTKVDVVQTGAGETTIAAGSGVTINSEGSKLKINAQWQAVSLIKRATNTWVLIGAIKS